MCDVRGDSVEPASPAPVCRRWFGDMPVAIGPMPASGFSGSQVFKVHPPASASGYVLKAFHANASWDHAVWVHRLAEHLRTAGVGQVPEVIAARDGGTLVADASGVLWELCRLMPGVAVARPGPRQAAAAGETLARLHLAAARLPGAWPRRSRSPGIMRRIEQARCLRAMPWEVRRTTWRRRHRDARPDFVAAVERRFDAAIDLFAAADGARWLDRVARIPVETMVVQPVLRDIWCDHVLHAGPTESDVTGIVDLHAAGIDSPATDIARLLGSWEVSADCLRLSPLDRHPEAIQAYERERPLAAEERMLVAVLHSTAVVFSLDNWFRWTLDEGREFSAAPRVLARIDGLLRELQPAIDGLFTAFLSASSGRS